MNGSEPPTGRNGPPSPSIPAKMSDSRISTSAASAAAEISMLLEDETGYARDLGDFIAYPSIQTLAEFISGKIADRSD